LEQPARTSASTNMTDKIRNVKLGNLCIIPS
jgi:hypothetical protein